MRSASSAIIYERGDRVSNRVPRSAYPIYTKYGSRADVSENNSSRRINARLRGFFRARELLVAVGSVGMKSGTLFTHVSCLFTHTNYATSADAMTYVLRATTIVNRRGIRVKQS